MTVETNPERARPDGGRYIAIRQADVKPQLRSAVARAVEFARQQLRLPPIEVYWVRAEPPLPGPPHEQGAGWAGWVRSDMPTRIFLVGNIETWRGKPSSAPLTIHALHELRHSFQHLCPDWAARLDPLHAAEREKDAGDWAIAASRVMYDLARPGDHERVVPACTKRSR